MASPGPERRARSSRPSPEAARPKESARERGDRLKRDIDELIATIEATLADCSVGALAAGDSAA
jgi:hypothetical protein